MYVTNAFLKIPAQPPCTLVLDPPLSDEEFETLSEKTEFAIVERTNEGTIVVNELSGWMTSSASSELSFQLENWSKQHQHGVALPHCGFFLPDGSCLSPDLAYVTAKQRDALTREERDHFLRFAPVFVIELRSQSDKLADMEKKMEVWIANGVELGWLVDPYAKEVHIYAPGVERRVETGSSVAGSGPVDGFVLDLTEVWSCYD
jgi:Uma2 family endonuclease